MKYTDQLKDPRWQKKRLEILERDEWKCKDCGNGKDTLHVHHHLYKKGAAPWEYPNALLGTLCDDCHKGRHVELSHLKTAIGCFTSELSSEQIERLHKAFMYKGKSLDMLTKIVNGEEL